MIRVSMELVPYGRRTLGQHPLMEARIWTDRDAGGAPLHSYIVRLNDGSEVASGNVPKHRTGHRNPLHLLKEICARIDCEALRADYVTTPFDEPDEAHRARLDGERLKDIAGLALQAVADLAKAGAPGWDLIGEIEAEIANRRRKHRPASIEAPTAVETSAVEASAEAMGAAEACSEATRAPAVEEKAVAAKIVPE